ncbi:MAG: respiratory chain complex I subunit 1 family protein [Pirellulales bacterium]
MANLIPAMLAFLLSPLMLGVINRTKAVVAGRRGAPLFQAYFDLFKLLRKGAVFSNTTSWVFRAGPVVSLAAMAVATLLVPLGSSSSAIHFAGDLVMLAYLFGVARFFTVVAALDTGSAFEGMGASREVFYSALAEPALLLGLAAVAKEAIGHSILIELTEMHRHVSAELWSSAGLILLFVSITLFVVLLAECSRIPVDDPNTHLELTMIHEVMVLDHSGPDLAMILYGAGLKLWLIAALIVGMVIPATSYAVVDAAIALAAMFVLAILVGLVESTMARLRLVRVPQLLVGATTLAVLALVLEYRG